MPAKPHANCAGSSGWRLSPRDSATRSAPAQKLLSPAPVMTTTRISGSFSASSSAVPMRSEEHTSELQSLMRISYAVFCLKKKKKQQTLTSATLPYITHYPTHIPDSHTAYVQRATYILRPCYI